MAVAPRVCVVKKAPMNKPVLLNYDQVPNMALQLSKAALARRTARADVDIPFIEARVSNVKTSPERLAAYRRVCGLPDTGTLPPTWPQVLAMPVHTAMLVHKSFPLPLLGLVHVSNVIEEHRPIANDESLELHCVIDASRPHRSGIEFDIRTTVSVKGDVAWTSVTTALVKVKGAGAAARKEERRREGPGEPAAALRSVIWHVPENRGREYARVAGDWNPIHVHALLARPFGFPRAIVHGLWTFARCVGESWDLLPDTPRRLEIAFRRPVLLPSTVSFSAQATEDTGGIAFSVRGRDGSTVYLTGSASPFVP